MPRIPQPGAVIIPARFNGPPGSGNGGYSAGLFAAQFASQYPGDAEVTLRSPPPLDTPMTVRADDGKVAVHDGDTLVAEVRPVTIELDIPTSPSLEQAETARERYLGYQQHEFPTCFTCGTERDDGLRVHPGPVFGTGLVASPWTAAESLPSLDDHLAPEVVWAALDCPGAWATMRELTSDPVVLGRMTARIVTPIPVGATLVSYGWQMGIEGRKAYAGTAIADARGRTMAYAKQTWIALK
ncbi:MAG: hypothetical protein WD184_04165 [Acidimicrobiia bacterium]